jgi:hypothetical protein
VTNPPSPSRARRALCAGALAALSALVGCTGSGPSPRESRTPGTADRGPASAAATPTAAPAPPDGVCYRLLSTDLARPTASSVPVPCTGTHTARTIFVGARGAPATTCPRKLADYVGGTSTRRRLSRLNVVWFTPPPVEAARGATWFRCDLVAFDVRDRLLGLPGRDRLRGVLDRPHSLDAYGLCGTAAPGSARFGRVICGRRHAWRAISIVGLRGGSAYPGAATVRRAGDRTCKRVARSRAGRTLSFRYGWEWPTDAQWAAGRHFGYCWVPLRS